MKTMPFQAYEGLLSGKPLEKTAFIYHFQEKRREYLLNNQKQKREETLIKSRRFLLETKLSYSQKESYMNEEEEFYEESKDQWTSEKFEAENPLFAELEKMELERDELQGKNKKKGKSGMKIEQDYEKRPMKSLARKLTVPEWMISPPSSKNLLCFVI